MPVYTYFCPKCFHLRQFILNPDDEAPHQCGRESIEPVMMAHTEIRNVIHICNGKLSPVVGITKLIPGATE